MCRLVGVVASELTEFALCLREAPRSLACLSREHPDGWGIAIHDGAPDAAWLVHKGVERAETDRRFHEIAAQSRGCLLVSHIRQKTVGPTRIENTHPFGRERWIFAHNGTIKDQETLRAGTSKARLSEIEGDTDSELLFAYLLTRLDEAGVVRPVTEDARDEATRIVGGAAASLRDKNVGAFNFLLADGRTTFVHRFGRTLFLLEKQPGDPVRELRAMTPGTTLLTRWTHRRHAILVASERLTDEPWEELPEGTFLRVDREPAPRIVPDVPARAAS